MDDRGNTPQSRGHAPWKPGESGNPNGRPKGFGNLIREQTRNGEELVEFALSLLRNRKQDLRYRVQAMEWLADRGWGKAVELKEVSGQIDIALKWEGNDDD